MLRSDQNKQNRIAHVHGEQIHEGTKWEEKNKNSTLLRKKSKNENLENLKKKDEWKVQSK